ncbi:unnamed protein product [Somion occarium]
MGDRWTPQRQPSQYQPSQGSQGHPVQRPPPAAGYSPTQLPYGPSGARPSPPSSYHAPQLQARQSQTSGGHSRHDAVAHPPPRIQPQTAPMTIWNWALNHSLKIETLRKESLEKSFNTRDESNQYSHNDIRHVIAWDLTLAEIQASPVYGILMLPLLPSFFDNLLMSRAFLKEPLYGSALRPPQDMIPFTIEAGLTSHLDFMLFHDLEFIQRYIAMARDLSRDLPQFRQFPNIPWTPLVTDVGSAAAKYRSYLPDRCSIPADVRLPSSAKTRCPGEIKVSYKFNAGWRDYCAVGDNLSASQANEALRMVEYKQVLSQVRHYMVKCGKLANSDLAAKYGYIITDKEVVLLQRHGNPRRENEHGTIRATRGFEWKSDGQSINGMLALLYIHCLAGFNEHYTLDIRV